MAKHAEVPESTQAELAPVGVRRKVFERVEERPEQTQRLVLVGVGLGLARAAAHGDALRDALAHETRRRLDPDRLVRDVVLPGA